MELLHAIGSRRAVREYTTEKVSRATLQHLLNVAVQAPSARNEQPWLFSVVEDPDRLYQINESAKSHLLSLQPPGAVSSFMERLSLPDFDILYQAPALVVIASAMPSEWAAVNCALAAQNLMLAAHAEGLGSCWIGLAQAWLGTPAGKAAVGLPPESVPVAPIILGHPRMVTPLVPRKAPVVRWIGE